MVSNEESTALDAALIQRLEEFRRARQIPDDARVDSVLQKYEIDPRERAAIDVADTWLHFRMSPELAAKMKKDMRDWSKEVRAAADRLAELLNPPGLLDENVPRRQLLCSDEAELARVQIIDGVESLERLGWRTGLSLEAHYKDKMAPEIQTLFRKAELLNKEEGRSRWKPLTLAAVVCYWRLDGYETGADDEGTNCFADVERKYRKSHAEREKRIRKNKEWR